MPEGCTTWEQAAEVWKAKAAAELAAWAVHSVTND